MFLISTKPRIQVTINKLKCILFVINSYSWLQNEHFCILLTITNYKTKYKNILINKKNIDNNSIKFCSNPTIPSKNIQSDKEPCQRKCTIMFPNLLCAVRNNFRMGRKNRKM